jgi:hypothetical protein
MVTIRSFAAATFILGKGIEPIAIDHSGASGFIFPDEAAAAFTEYQRVSRRLNAMLDQEPPTVSPTR